MSNNQSVRYTFDELSRLIEVTYGSGTRTVYTYDWAGNPMSETTVAAPLAPAEQTRPTEPLLAEAHTATQAQPMPIVGPDSDGQDSRGQVLQGPPEAQPWESTLVSVPLPQVKPLEVKPAPVNSPEVKPLEVKPAPVNSPEVKMPEVQTPTLTSAVPRFCIKCGTRVQAGKRFCIQCGHRIEG